jgi:outer membrane protein assembly factor BamA
VRTSPAGELNYVTLDGDARKYFRLGSTSAIFAVRARGFRSTGNNPEIMYFGGNMEMRGYNYLSFSGTEGFFTNVELRLPIVHAMLTPIGVMGPIRATVFGNLGAAKYPGQDFNFSSSDSDVSYVNDPVFGTPVNGFHLVDGRASYGVGLQMVFLGYPMHFDFSKLTDFQVNSADWRFDFWIGYDF